MTQHKQKFHFEIIYKDRFVKLNFQLRSGNIDFPSYNVYSDDGSFHLYIDLDENIPGKYNYAGHEKLPVRCLINGLMTQINAEIKLHQFF